LCDGKPFWADLVIRRRAIDAWLGAKQKDVLKNFERKVRETEWENAEVVGIYELCSRLRRGMFLLIGLWKRESYRKRISPKGSCSMAVGKIAASGLLKKLVLADQNVLCILKLPPAMRICSQHLSSNP
jgi:hypothetical protein